MLDRPRFWWRAVRRGVTSLNTLAGWFGLIVLVLGVAAGITVPVVFHVSHWVTAVIIMTAAVVVVLEGSYLEWKDSDELQRKAQSDLANTRGELEDARRAAVSASAEPMPPPFELRLWRRPVLTQGGVTQHLIGVTDPAGQPERRARIVLDGMKEHPRNAMYPRFAPVIPSMLPLQGGGDPAAGMVIQPGQEESWVVGFTGIGGDGSMNAGGFANGDQRWSGLPWRLDPDEQWLFFYRIECDGVPDVKFSIVVDSPDGKTIRVALAD